MFDRLRRDPGLALLLLALFAAIALYAPSITRGLINFDDPVLYRDNWVVQEPTSENLHAIWFELHSPRRDVLLPEYLPIRDMSVMLDYAIWGTHYGGFHLTNLLLYLAAISLWFGALSSFGIDRRVAGLAVLLWALHPAHAESVAWLSERKGLLGATFAGATAFAYGKYRAGASMRWVVLALVTTVCAVWSKALAAFAVAAIAGFELALPERRVSWRRSIGGLVALAVVGGLAFLPVLSLAASADVVGTHVKAPAGRAELVLGVLGFYLRMGMMLDRNAVTYPIATDGPSMLDLALGALGVLALLVAIVPTKRVRVAPVLRAAALLWLFAWLPASHLVLPLQMVFVADRYLLVPSLALALALAFAITRIPTARARWALAVALCLGAAVRSFDAQRSWSSDLALWDRAMITSPRDGEAWSRYAQTLADAGNDEAAMAAVETGLARVRSSRLLLRKALFLLPLGRRDEARELLAEAANKGEPRAMANLALILAEDGQLDEALRWARNATSGEFPYVPGLSARGKIALEAGLAGEALEMFERVHALAPKDLVNRYNVALALIRLHRAPEALPHLIACAKSGEVGAACRAELAKFQRVR